MKLLEIGCDICLNSPKWGLKRKVITQTQTYHIWSRSFLENTMSSSILISSMCSCSFPTWSWWDELYTKSYLSQLIISFQRWEQSASTSLNKSSSKTYFPPNNCDLYQWSVIYNSVLKSVLFLAKIACMKNKTISPTQIVLL